MFVPIRGYSARGRYPATEDQLRALFRARSTNGLASAFCKVGGRVLFDADIAEAAFARIARGEVASDFPRSSRAPASRTSARGGRP